MAAPSAATSTAPPEAAAGTESKQRTVNEAMR